MKVLSQPASAAHAVVWVTSVDAASLCGLAFLDDLLILTKTRLLRRSVGDADKGDFLTKSKHAAG